jgi:malate dehydrogenase
MVPVTSYCTVNGVPIKTLIGKDKLDAIVTRTAGGGGEIVKLMGTSAYYAPATSAIAMAKAYLHDEKRLLPAAAYCDGDYGYKDMYIGVPVIIGGNGVEKIVSISLTAEEKANLDKSAAAVRDLLEASKKL